MLGEVLTAIVTPFRADGSVDYDRFRELARTSRRPRLRRPRRHRHDRRVADAHRRGALRALRGGPRGGRRPGDRGRRHRHLLDRALGSPDRAGARARRPRLPGRHAVLQQAAAARHRRALPAIADVSDRPIVVYNIPGRVVVNIEPETIAELAEIPTVAAVKQATTTSTRRAGSSSSARPLRRRRRPGLPVPPARRRRRHLRPHPLVGPRMKELVRAPRTATRRPRAVDRELEPSTSC